MSGLGITFGPADYSIVSAAPDQAWTNSLETVAPNITTFVAEQRMQDESWIDALERILPVVVSTWQQKEILQVQVERAKNGLPPLDASQLAAGVNVGLSPDVKRMLMIGGAALLAALVYVATQRRR